MFGKTRLHYAIIFLFEIASCSSHTEKTVVESNVGTIKGLRASDGDYFMYLGIPYANVDPSNPFGPSLPLLSVEGTFEAYNDSYMCPQINQKNNLATGTLDCLRLNIYVPETSSEHLHFPVMIWIYGGSFQYGHAGNSLYGPSYMVQHEVIVVTFNYRTGPYGFMCLDIPEVSGNQGLKDQHLAIQWVKNNIAAFGGNADQITLFGAGAGGQSIDLHLMSTKELLFNKIILQSGSSQSVTLRQEPDKSAPLKMARYVGFETNNIKDALKFLAKTDFKLVIAATHKLRIQFKPCAEALFDDVEPFIAHSWINLKMPKIKNMPVLMGFNKHELARVFSLKQVEYFKNLTIVYDNLRQAFEFSDNEISELGNLVSRFYFGGEEITEKKKWKLIDFTSDFIYIHPIYRNVHKYIRNGAGNIYFYMLSYIGGRNAINITVYDENDPDGHACCASHADDLGYLFNMKNQPELFGTDQTVMERMTTMWTNFVKYSNPTPVKCTLLPKIWEPFKHKIQYYLNIDSDISLEKNPLHDRIAFWDLFYRHNKQYQKGYEQQRYNDMN